MKIITVTLNPCIDKSAEIDEIRIGGLNRLLDLNSHLGGKGYCVSRTLANLGGESIAMGFISDEIKEIGFAGEFVKISSLRVNLKVISNGILTEFSEQGKVNVEERDELFKKIKSKIAPGDLVAVMGSLPNGIKPKQALKLLLDIKAAGASLFLDADGEFLKLGILAKPDYLKPNAVELCEFLDIKNEEELINLINSNAELLRQRLGKRAKLITVSLGASGAYFITPNETLYFPALPITVRNTAGAGDAMSAAICYSVLHNLELKETARLAMATSAAACMTIGTLPPSKTEIEKLKNLKEFNKVNKK